METDQRPLRILVVDDHEDTAKMLTRLLSRSGHAVKYATGHQSAVAAAQAAQFDVLLCDIGLPDGNGCDLLAQVMAMYPIKSVAMTGYGMPHEIEKFKAAGFNAYLMKPYDFDRVNKAIADLTKATSPVD